jgi:glycosyltransferase involved in cell wall biosynthesis
MDILYIVIPAYNEEENIANVIADWHAVVEKAGAGSKLLIFNDGSRDHTYEVASALKERYPNLEVISNSNSGHGPTCLLGYRQAIAAGADYIFQTDSDGQTNPEEFWNFWERRAVSPFIIGVRQNRLDGFSRKIVTNVLRMVLLAIFGVNVKDANTPYRLMNAKLLSRYLEHIPGDFFLGNALLSTIAVKRNDSVTWIPITFKSRQGGENSIKLKRIFLIGVKAVIELIKFTRTSKEFLNGDFSYAEKMQNTISR